MTYQQEQIKPYTPEGSKGKQVEKMFDSIAHSYDALNHILSLGIDRAWRRAAIDSLIPYTPQQILDIATGTGDFALLAMQRLSPKYIMGIDLSEGMLTIGRKKITQAGLSNRMILRKADCMQLDLPENSFDAVTVAYGIRNFEDLDRGLREMYRVLRPEGRLVIVELTTPISFPMKYFFRFYARVLMPCVGKFLSRDKYAYTYLPATMEAFPQGEIMEKILQKIGFKDVKFHRFTFGLSTLYTAAK